LSGLTVVVCREGAKNGEVVTSFGQSAPASSSIESKAVSAFVVCGTTAGNSNAGLSRRTPGETG